MKKFMIALLITSIFYACEEDEGVEPQVEMEQNDSTACGDRQICFTLNDTAYTNQVFMYKLDDSTYFAKYEKDGKQLSIDWITSAPSLGAFPAQAIKENGKSRVYWFPGNNIMWMSTSGTVEITKHENNTVSATFNGVLKKMVNNQPTNDSIEVKNGVFTNGKYS